jgi:peptide/nickel transport system substrate-binding protein
MSILYLAACTGRRRWNYRPFCPARPANWRRRFSTLLSVAVVLWLLGGSGSAASLRVGLATDVATMDPHALNAGSTTLVLRQVYEPLVGRGKDWRKAPALALEWSNPEPTRWRFRLRPNVRFHDGSTFDADDVVFSINRAGESLSDFRIYAAGIVEVRRVDALTVDILTAQPDPVLPDKLTRILIMDRDWARRHDAERPQDFGKREASHAAANANGTGPYRLRLREPDGRTELTRSPEWWGDDKPEIEDIKFQPIPSDGPRIAALLAGDIDFVVDVPPELVDRVQKDARFRILEKPDNRTVYLGLDTARNELLHGDVKGKNPLKDQRVRQAMWLAIDARAIHSSLMGGHSVPTALMWAPSVFGYAAEDDIRPPVDHDQARRLLAEAGYPSGFGITLDCPVDRYTADKQICQAVAAQFARINVRVTANPLPFSVYIGKLRRFDTSFYLLGWAVPTFDALVTLQALMRTPGPGGDGSGNFGRYSNPALDTLIDRIKIEGNATERLRLIRDAARLHKADVGYIPIHHQTIIWAMRADIDAVQPPENQFDVKWVTIRR